MVEILSSSSISMSNERLFSSYLTLTILLLCCTESCRAQNSSFCITSSCGNINISYPFRLRSDPANCGHPDPIFALDCQKNEPTLLTQSRRYHVEAITYSNFSIRISDPGLDSNNISSCPIYSYLNDDIYQRYVYRYYSNYTYLTYINCLSPLANTTFYVENPFCGNTTALSNSSRIYSYVTAKSILVPDLEDSCTFDTMVQASSFWPSTDENYSYAQIHDMLAYGFELLWYPALCTECDESKGTCSLEGNEIKCRHYCYESTPLEERTFFCKLEYYGAVFLYIAVLAIGGLIALRFILGMSCIIGIAVNERKKRRRSSNIEQVLRDEQVNHMPINYSYREIKKMSQNCKTKLGGSSVFRGSLRSGPPVAVEMLNTSSSASGRDLIMHASAISKISHANVVKLYGFCMHANKRALVREFVQRGSLEEHINKRDLSIREMFKVAVGVAGGVQCLHAAKILHLAINPKKILLDLDEDLNPKILDSGMEKGNKVGFMAPELVYKNVGEVSCKADVYSFGMVVLEMAARLNLCAREVYFPLWIYKQLCEGKELGMRGGEEEEEEREMMKKMIVAALWCIQIRSGERPMMDEVVGMLQGGIQLLHMPPMPFHRHDDEL